MSMVVTISLISVVDEVDTETLREINNHLKQGKIKSLKGASLEWDGEMLDLEMDDYAINYDYNDLKEFCLLLSKAIRKGYAVLYFSEIRDAFIIFPESYEETISTAVPSEAMVYVNHEMEKKARLK